MIQDSQTSTATPGTSLRFARPGFERPVDHLHLDRRTRVWYRHDELPAETTRPVTAASTDDDRRCA